MIPEIAPAWLVVLMLVVALFIAAPAAGSRRTRRLDRARARRASREETRRLTAGTERDDVDRGGAA